MFAVIEDSGQQFRVSEGDVLDVDLRDLHADQKEIEFDKILLVSDDSDTKIGTPVLDGVKVIAEIIDEELKGKKIHTYRWRRRKNSRRKTGHRQRYVRVKITKIVA